MIKEASLSEGALYDIVRGLADRGEDYGWNVYYKGTTISKRERAAMIAIDDSAEAWLEAWDFALELYQTRTGTSWSY